MITAESFVEYYKDINATLPAGKDAYFVDLIMRTWNIYEATKYTTPEHIEKLETLLFEKLRQRTQTKEDEGKALLKAMRYVDDKNTGTLNIEQFSKMLTNIGCVLKPDDVKSLFEKFDFDESGKLCCDNLSNYFALKGAGKNPNVDPKFKVEAGPPFQVLQKIKKNLLEKGAYGIRGLSNLFRRIDAHGNRRINRHDFSWAMKENGHALSSLEFERLFKYFDRNNEGFINYEEFMTGVRGELSQKRKTLVYDIFLKIGGKRIKLPNLIAAYNVDKQPKVNIELLNRYSSFQDKWQEKK